MHEPILLTLAYGVSDKKTLHKVMEHTSLVKGDVRVRLLKQLPQDKMMEKVFDDVKGCGISSWNEGKIEALEGAMKIGAQVKDKKVALKIYSSVFQKISYFKQELQRWIKTVLRYTLTGNLIRFVECIRIPREFMN